MVYINEYILLCKRGDSTWVLPWSCVSAFGALVFVQLRQMRDVAAAWFACAGDGGDETGAVAFQTGCRSVRMRGAAFWVADTGAWVGLVLVVVFDWRDAGEASVAWHRVGVGLLAAGGFFALQLVWVTLRTGDSVARLRGGEVAEVPSCSWVETDLVFVVVMCVFVVTTLVGTGARRKRGGNGAEARDAD